MVQFLCPVMPLGNILYLKSIVFRLLYMIVIIVVALFYHSCNTILTPSLQDSWYEPLFLASFSTSIIRQAIELESCLNPQKMQQVF